jgi:SAM-dependent methyltransferase
MSIIPATEIDVKIRSMIENEGLEYYDETFDSNTPFSVYQHLSVLRTGLFAWYPFQKGARLLEIGGGNGALTGILCDRCEQVTVTERSDYRGETIRLRWKNKNNLTVRTGDWQQMAFETPFDYVILTGILDRVCDGRDDWKEYGEYLSKLVRLLATGGKLLLAVDNRLGARYLSGGGEPHTKRPYDGINGYPARTSGRSFTLQELQEILDAAEIENRYFYYPLPDYRLPQVIYSDARLPEGEITERVMPYEPFGCKMLINEKILTDDLIANGMFAATANSFLVECSRDDRIGEVQYTALSTDRGIAGAYATILRSDSVVIKKPIFPEGIPSALQVQEHMNALKARGIPVLEQTWDAEDCEIRMPYITHPTLNQYIKKTLPLDAAKVIAILDDLYHYILQASAISVSGRNRLLEHIMGKLDHLGSMKQKACEADFGPILEKAYLELIPLNCFYDESNGKYLFFDQEYVREDYPAKYVLYRAIAHIYAFNPKAERYYPLAEMQKRYGMEELWQYFVMEEELFIEEVRNMRQYEAFYRWTR